MIDNYLTPEARVIEVNLARYIAVSPTATTESLGEDTFVW